MTSLNCAWAAVADKRTISATDSRVVAFILWWLNVMSGPQVGARFNLPVARADRFLRLRLGVKARNARHHFMSSLIVQFANDKRWSRTTHRTVQPTPPLPPP